jgi:hypothetical protein
MSILIAGAAPTSRTAEPTPLLKLLAGEFALRVARLWPAPHTEFVTAPAARRHLVFLAFTLGRDVASLRDTILARRVALAIAAAAPKAPAGLTRALTHIGEVAWPAEGYRKLLQLLADPAAAKVLRHAPAIEVQTVLRIAALPPALGGAAPIAIGLGPGAVEALQEAYAAVRFRAGQAAADRAAARWARARSAKALMAAVKDDLFPEPAKPPHPGTDRLRPLATKAALRAAARRYRNCLAELSLYAGSGWSAYYEWVGPPGAVLEVSRDAVFGWRLEQARLARNAPVPDALREEIISELALIGIHVGRNGWELDRALSADPARDFPLRPVEAAIAQAFEGE